MLLYSLTTGAKIVLLIVAVTFILWALVTSMFIPRRKPDFPGDRKLSVFLTITVALFAAQIGTVWWATGQEAEAHGEEAAATETAHPETEAEETETTEPEPTETGSEPAAAGDPVAGSAVFASAGCGSCHTLADAGSSGAVGPNLDESSPSYDKVVERVTEGKGAMPSFADQLNEEQIGDVAAYVSTAAGA